MNKKSFLIRVLVLACVSSSAWADEGMWLLNQLPVEVLKSKYGFEPTTQWTDHVMKSSVRLNSGGSGSFLSQDGLLLTNHHVAADTLYKKSTEEHNYYRDGFLAKTREEEIPAADLEVNVLQSIEDVTDRVNAAVKPEMTPDQAAAARKAVTAEIESKSADESHGIRANVVAFYNGGKFHLYIYKKYTDIRIVWAPEFSIAFFGGDGDNFEYPRYDLDAALFRVYENGVPARTENFLKLSQKGAAEGELIFVSGHPGKTNRLNTVASLLMLRDQILPFRIAFFARREILLQQYGLRGKEQARQAKNELFGIQNSRKAYLGKRQALQDPKVIALKQAEENALRVQINGKEEFKDYRGAWDVVALAEKNYGKLFKRHLLLEGAMGFGSRLFSIARALVRLNDENQKPNSERLEEFRDSGRGSLEQSLFSSATLYPELEEFRLADTLSFLADQLGYSDPLVIQVLDGKTPQARAAELVRVSRLSDVNERKRLAKVGSEEIRASTDPMIQLAILVDPAAREVRKNVEAEVIEPETQAYSKISKAVFAVKGTSVYPDATFTLRLSFGAVKGFTTAAGKVIPPFTTLGGAFEHEKTHEGMADYILPKTWSLTKDSLDLSTHFNFISTADIIGGNSGSPVINKEAELVGLIFDGNIESLAGDYVYDGSSNRAVSVDSNAIVEALKKIYKADAILAELQRN